jgi:hypothetical protein
VWRVRGVARHQVIQFDLRAFGGSALTSDVDVPKGRTFPTPAFRYLCSGSEYNLPFVRPRLCRDAPVRLISSSA